jgi:hypothetical protein
MKKFVILFLLSVFFSARAQVNVKDSAVFAPMFYAQYAFQIPGGDLAERFGSNSNVGGGFQLKTKKTGCGGLNINICLAPM